MFEKVVTPLLAMNDVRNAWMTIVGSTKYWKAESKVSNVAIERLPPSSEPSSMADSYSRVLLQLSKPEIWERYVNSMNQIRTGRLLEDLDMFATYVAYKHNRIIQSDKMLRANFSVVTASIDRIIVHQYALPRSDILMTGHVSWVGRSSMETTVYMDQKDYQDQDGKIRNILKARFVMVAIDPEQKRPIPVSPLALTSPEEKEIQQKGEEHHVRRAKTREISLFKHPPGAKESSLVHELYLQTLDPHLYSFQRRIKHSDDAWMRDTSIKNIVICHPQKRNMYGNIFGGYLLKTAYELAWAGAWAFTRSRPSLVAMDDMVFRKPVTVGSLLWLHQSIGYTEGNLLQSLVTAAVSDPNDPTRREVANDFHFTFRAPLPTGHTALPRIIPDSYGEAMLFLDSRRRMDTIKEIFQRKGIKLANN